MHGACRQFFEASEACVEVEEGGEGGGEGVGWRRAMNRAGVVQVIRVARAGGGRGGCRRRHVKSGRLFTW